MNIIKTLLNIVFPINCLACRKNGVEFCIDCLYSSPANPRENAPWVYPLFDYRHPPIKKAVWLLKYKNTKNIANIFAKVIYESMTEELSELSIMRNFTSPLLIPVPLSKKRKRKRGYNQSEVLARALMRIDKQNNKNNDLELGLDILKKIKDTESQANIKSRNKRLKNLAGSFRVIHPEKIRNRNIILIDDVTTTGATLSEARKVLKSEGAKKIIAFTIAH